MPVLSQTNHRSGRSTWFSNGVALAAAALFGMVATWAVGRYVRAHIGHDQAWELYASAEVLRGVPMNSVDLVEVNPPFLLWFMTLPVLLARTLHIGPIDGFRVFFLTIALAGTVWSASLFRRLVQPRRLVFWMFLLLVAWAGGMNMIVEDLAQREHLVVFLLLPYLLLAAMRIERGTVSPAEGVAAGVAAAVAVCLKPQHLLDVSAVEALALWRLRRLKTWFHPAWAAFSACLIAYFCAARVFAPTYFTDIVPLLRSTYWGFNSPMHQVLYMQRRSILRLGAAVLFLWALRTRLRLVALDTVLLAAGLGALAAYVQQHKAWTYQMICVEFLTILLVGLILVDLADRALAEFWPEAGKLMPSLYPLAAAFAGALAAVGAMRSMPQPDVYPERAKADLAAVYGAYPAGTAVGFLSVFPWQFPAIVEQDKVWASRYFHLWMLPAILRSGNPADDDLKDHLSSPETERLSSLLRSTEAADLARWRPAVVAVQDCTLPSICEGLERQHAASVLDWFLRDPGFRAEWAHYTYQETVHDLNVYKRLR